MLHATREGQTRRIAERIAGVFRNRGLAVVAADVRQGGAGVDLGGCSGAVLAASVHLGRYEPEMVKFAKAHATTLYAMPTAFVAVSMSQATVDRQDVSEDERARSRGYVRQCTDRFVKETGWQPRRIVPLAGALLYTKYNFIVRLIMKGIARRAGHATDTTRDYDFTDWGAVERFAESFAADQIARASTRR